MRRLSEDELDDLQILVRSYCDYNGMKLKDFVGRAGKRAGGGEAAYKVIDRCVTNKEAKFKAYASVILEELHAIVKDDGSSDAKKYQQCIEVFEADKDYRKADGVAAFLDQRQEALSKERKKRLQNRPFKNHIGRVLAVAARKFDASDTDVDFFDRRIGDSRYVCIRNSSRQRGRYVVHGLRFAPHWGEPEVYYFSEKYRPRADRENHERRSEGVCFKDGDYLTAIARSGQDLTTYFIGYLPKLADPDKPFESFEAMISATNSEGERIGAAALCLRCTSKDDRKAKVGVFSYQELVALFDEKQRRLIEEWAQRTRLGVHKIGGPSAFSSLIPA